MAVFKLIRFCLEETEMIEITVFVHGCNEIYM